VGLSIPKLEHGWGKELERQRVFAINQVPPLKAVFPLPGETVTRNFPRTINILLREGGYEFSADCLRRMSGSMEENCFSFRELHTEASKR